MGTIMIFSDGKNPTSATELLEIIAERLDCSVEDFYVEAGKMNSLIDQAELMQLWDKITTDEGRHSVLVFARKIAILSH